MPKMAFPRYKRGRNGIECGSDELSDKSAAEHVRPNEDSEFFDALVDRMCFDAWGCH